MSVSQDGMRNITRLVVLSAERSKVMKVYFTVAGTNHYYDSAGAESTTTLTTPFLFRQKIFTNDANNVVGSCIRNNTASNTTGNNENVESMRNVLPSAFKYL